MREREREKYACYCVHRCDMSTIFNLMSSHITCHVSDVVDLTFSCWFGGREVRGWMVTAMAGPGDGGRISSIICKMHQLLSAKGELMKYQLILNTAQLCCAVPPNSPICISLLMKTLWMGIMELIISWSWPSVLSPQRSICAPFTVLRVSTRTSWAADTCTIFAARSACTFSSGRQCLWATSTVPSIAS